MMIFDRFPTPADAEFFAVAAREQTNEAIIVCHNQEEFEKHDVFPWELDYPVVLVPRLDGIGNERVVEDLVEKFAGEFAGT